MEQTMMELVDFEAEKAGKKRVEGELRPALELAKRKVSQNWKNQHNRS